MFSLKKNGMSVLSLQLTTGTAVIFPDTEANFFVTGSDDFFCRAKKALLVRRSHRTPRVLSGSTAATIGMSVCW